MKLQIVPGFLVPRLDVCFPFKFLEVPVGANMSLKRNWSPIVERVQNRLSSWKIKNLSFGGILTLVKFILDSLPLYLFSLFKALKSIIDHIEKLRRRFLWGGNEEKKKINWVAWKVALGLKESGTHQMVVEIQDRT